MNWVLFELETKKTLVQNLVDTLVTGLIKEFEDRFTKHFRKTDKPIHSLITSYLQNTSFDSSAEQKQFFKLLQFLSFSRGKTFLLEYIWEQTYYAVEFKISEFIRFMKIENKSYYQIKKVKEFL